MTLLLDPVTEHTALAPVCEALLAAARAGADRVTGQAEADASAMLAAASAQAAQILAAARTGGTADAAAAMAAEQARARRQARAAVLRARREAYERLRTQARAAVAELVHQPGYARLRARLATVARAALGPEADVRDADGGGVIGTVPGRRVDLSLARFADRAVDAVAAEAAL